MKWGVDLSTQLSKKGPNHRDEWPKKTKSCNTILDAHIKNLTPKKGKSPIGPTVHKHAVLEPKSRPNKEISSQRLQDTWHFVDKWSVRSQTLWTCRCSMTPSTKPMQNPPPSKAPEVSWYQPWHLDIPTSFWNLSRVQSISATSQYALIVSMDLKIRSNISVFGVFVTNPWNPSNSIKVLISTSHPDLRGVAACSCKLRGPGFGLNAKSSDLELPVVRNYRSKLKQHFFLLFGIFFALFQK